MFVDVMETFPRPFSGELPNGILTASHRVGVQGGIHGHDMIYCYRSTRRETWGEGETRAENSNEKVYDLRL